MPIQGSDSAPDGFLDVFGHPPIIFLLEITDRNEAGSGAHCKLVLLRTPFDACGRTVDP